MPPQRVTLIVYGSHSYLGQEVARLGRAMGHRIVVAVDGTPPSLDAPWMHGVHWTSDTDPLTQSWPEAPLVAAIYCQTALWDGATGRFNRLIVDALNDVLAAATGRKRPPRIVLRSTIAQPLLPAGYTAAHHRAETLVLRSPLPSAIFRLPLIYGPDRPDSVAAMAITNLLRRWPLGQSGADLAPMRVELAALAMLRAALEPRFSGIFDPPAIATMGDVMIAQ